MQQKVKQQRLEEQCALAMYRIQDMHETLSVSDDELLTYKNILQEVKCYTQQRLVIEETVLKEKALNLKYDTAYKLKTVEKNHVSLKNNILKKYHKNIITKKTYAAQLLKIRKSFKAENKRIFRASQIEKHYYMYTLERAEIELDMGYRVFEQHATIDYYNSVFDRLIEDCGIDQTCMFDVETQKQTPFGLCGTWLTGLRTRKLGAFTIMDKTR